MKRTFFVSRVIALTGVVGLLTVLSCGKDYLNVPNPNVLQPASFPTKTSDLDLMLIDLYGRLRNGIYYSSNYTRFGMLLDHSADQGYGGDYTPFGQNVLQASNPTVNALYAQHYENVTRCNAFLQLVTDLRAKQGSIQDVAAQLDLQEGQARFIRAFNYYFLINYFGESMITGAADRAKMGVPLWDQVATDIAATNKERATVGAVWDFIVADLLKAEQLLAGKTWDDANKPRVDIWATKAFLGKAYVFTQQWDKAAAKLAEVITQSGKTLAPFATYRAMFNGQNKFNQESIFEINFTPDTKDVWSNQLNTSTQIGVFASPSFIDASGVNQTNGFGNLFVHDKNLLRYGFRDTTTVNQSDPAYVRRSVQARQAKTVDPRLTVVALQPFVDSLRIDGTWRPVGKNRGEFFSLTFNKAWCHRKFQVLDRNIWADAGPSVATNLYFLRLADVYLLYAEALQQTGNAGQALEYINKVHRRAYGVPVDGASSYDYKSLTDRTVADAGDPLASDPLKYERWAEFVDENQWWFDTCRWKLGAKETAYFQTVTSGSLNWVDTKYATPIPLAEIQNNNLAKQNPGY